MNSDELQKILDNHLIYLEIGNIRLKANLEGINLVYINLTNAYLEDVDLANANLRCRCYKLDYWKANYIEDVWLTDED